MNLRASADVDSAGRLVDNQKARLGGKPFAEHNFLLVTARKVASDLMTVRSLDPQGSDILLGQTIFGLQIEKGASHYLPNSSQADVLGDGHGDHQALALAVFRGIGYAERYCILWPRNLNRSTVKLNRPRLWRSHAKHCLR